MDQDTAGFELLEHTADIGLSGPVVGNPRGGVEQAAWGLPEVQGSLWPSGPGDPVAVERLSGRRPRRAGWSTG
jgi:hypothetical protein